MKQKNKYIFLKEELLRNIRAGAYPDGTPVDSESELSAKFGLSRNTVRQALGALEQEGYLYRIQGKGSFVRALNSVNSKKIALLLYDISYLLDSVTGRLVAGLDSILSRNGYILDILASRRSFRDENISKLAENYAGFAIGAYQMDPLTLEEFDRLAVPHLFVKNYLPGRENEAIRIDFEKAGFLAAGHLIECGCRELGLIYPGCGRMRIADDFYSGVCRAALENRTFLRRENIFEADFYDRSGIADVCDRIVSSARRPDAVVCMTDSAAAVLLNELRSAEIGVPGEMMVTGCNDTDFASMLPTTLTTLRIPAFEAGAVAAKNLLKMIAGGMMEASVLEPELVIRNSTIRKELLW